MWKLVVVQGSTDAHQIELFWNKGQAFVKAIMNH
jgi:hypothetical protein